MINSDLKLVVPIKDDLYAYHNPISREVYEANFRLLRDTKAAMWPSAKAASFSVGDAVLYLKEAGRELAFSKEQEGDYGATALLKEIRRLTSVILPGKDGWETLTAEGALASKRLEEEDWEEAEAAIVFFTCVPSGATKKAKPEMQEWAASLLGCEITSSPPMEWIASSRTSTEAETSAKKAGSSVPS